MKPSIGRIVHVRIGGTDEAPIWRPGIVVSVHGPELCNVAIFLDHHNDAEDRVQLRGLQRVDSGRAHGYSLSPGEGLNNWRWPPRE